jgi:predicted lipoprotein with Yx(FWY)xxD motif
LTFKTGCDILLQIHYIAEMEGPTDEKGGKKFYGKRPLWQWIVIYLVIAAVVYGVIYYIFWGRNGGYSTKSANTPSVTTTHTAPVDASNIYKTQTSSSLGTYLTDFAGTSLYISSADSKGVSNCTGSCATTWPPYTSGATAQGTFPTNISVITRSDGTKQFTYKGMPLYYYSGDTAAGQTNGNDLGTFKLATP